LTPDSNMALEKHREKGLKGLPAGVKVAGLVLAAGASTRMNRTKLLLPLGRKTILETVMEKALASRLDRVVLVLGHNPDEIKHTLKQNLLHPGITVVENMAYRKGISTSIRAGLAEVEAGSDHVMILLADMPFITVDLINHLLLRHVESGMPMGAIKTGKRRTHPVIFSREMYKELHLLKGDVGARDLFEQYHDRVCVVEPAGDYDDRDIDTPEDYEKIKRQKLRS